MRLLLPKRDGSLRVAEVTTAPFDARAFVRELGRMAARQYLEGKLEIGEAKPAKAG